MSQLSSPLNFSWAETGSALGQIHCGGKNKYKKEKGDRSACAEGRDNGDGEGKKKSTTTVSCALHKTCLDLCCTLRGGSVKRTSYCSYFLQQFCPRLCGNNAKVLAHLKI